MEGVNVNDPVYVRKLGVRGVYVGTTPNRRFAAIRATNGRHKGYILLVNPDNVVHRSQEPLRK